VYGRVVAGLKLRETVGGEMGGGEEMDTVIVYLFMCKNTIYTIETTT
jgi:hypothetical protein